MKWFCCVVIGAATWGLVSEDLLAARVSNLAQDPTCPSEVSQPESPLVQVGLRYRGSRAYRAPVVYGTYRLTAPYVEVYPAPAIPYYMPYNVAPYGYPYSARRTYSLPYWSPGGCGYSSPGAIYYSW